MILECFFVMNEDAMVENLFNVLQAHCCDWMFSHILQWMQWLGWKENCKALNGSCTCFVCVLSESKRMKVKLKRIFEKIQFFFTSHIW